MYAVVRLQEQVWGFISAANWLSDMMDGYGLNLSREKAQLSL
jgi:hypothetical protein